MCPSRPTCYTAGSRACPELLNAGQSRRTERVIAPAGEAVVLRVAFELCLERWEIRSAYDLEHGRQVGLRGRTGENLEWAVMSLRV